MLDHYKLKDMKGQKVADVGGGLGFLGELIDPSNDYWVFDGAASTPETRVCKGTWVKCDIQRDDFGRSYWTLGTEHSNLAQDVSFGHETPIFDIGFCLESLEHLSNPYHCLVQIKQMVKRDGTIILSIPTESVTHNTVYPTLLWPPQNFHLFLQQMALPVEDFWVYQPTGRGWPAYHFKCRNADWTESRMLFFKDEPKFRGVTPLQSTNL